MIVIVFRIQAEVVTPGQAKARIQDFAVIFKPYGRSEIGNFVVAVGEVGNRPLEPGHGKRRKSFDVDHSRVEPVTDLRGKADVEEWVGLGCRTNLLEVGA